MWRLAFQPMLLLAPRQILWGITISTQDPAQPDFAGTGPKVMFAYASGTGEVPGSISISTNGTQLAYIEDQLTGSSVFHVLTIGTGSDGGHQSDRPRDARCNGEVTHWIQRCHSQADPEAAPRKAPPRRPSSITHDNTCAYVTTYAWTGAGTGTGCLYKINNVFGGTGSNHHVERPHQRCSIEPGLGYCIERSLLYRQQRQHRLRDGHGNAVGVYFPRGCGRHDV